MTDDTDIVRRLTRRLTTEELTRLRQADPAELDEFSQPVLRSGEPIPLAQFRALAAAFWQLRDNWVDPRREIPQSDRWLAPRIHWALRLHRREAADQSMWAYVAAAVWPEYVHWRWGSSGEIASNRWVGPHHKQALARLWWGAELFRNGADYRPVEKLFANQDFPNSYVHRVFTRNRPMALGLIDALYETTGDVTKPTSDQINDVAKKVNLYLGTRSVEAATGFYRGDAHAYTAWAESDGGADVDWSLRPDGPDDGSVPRDSERAATTLSVDVCRLAGLGDSALDHPDEETSGGAEAESPLERASRLVGLKRNRRA